MYPTDAHINFNDLFFSADVDISVLCVFTETSLTTFTLSINLTDYKHMSATIPYNSADVITTITTPHEDATKLSK